LELELEFAFDFKRLCRSEVRGIFSRVKKLNLIGVPTGVVPRLPAARSRACATPLHHAPWLTPMASVHVRLGLKVAPFCRAHCFEEAPRHAAKPTPNPSHGHTNEDASRRAGVHVRNATRAVGWRYAYAAVPHADVPYCCWPQRSSIRAIPCCSGGLHVHLAGENVVSFAFVHIPGAVVIRPLHERGHIFTTS